MTSEELASNLGGENPALPWDALARLELAVGAEIPSDFIAFLQVRNGGHVLGSGP
jgi:hypothetical protein